MDIPIFGLPAAETDCTLRCIESELTTSDNAKASTKYVPRTVDIRIHRATVAAASPFFKNLLTNNNFLEAGQATVQLQDVNCHAMTWILFAMHQIAAEEHQMAETQLSNDQSAPENTMSPAVNATPFQPTEASKSSRIEFEIITNPKATVKDDLAVMRQVIVLSDYLLLDEAVVWCCFATELDEEALLRKGRSQVPLGMAKELGDNNTFRRLTRLMVYGNAGKGLARFTVADPQNSAWSYRGQAAKLGQVLREIHEGLLEHMRIAIKQQEEPMRHVKHDTSSCRGYGYVAGVESSEGKGTRCLKSVGERELEKLLARCRAFNSLAKLAKIEKGEYSFMQMLHGYDVLLLDLEAARCRTPSPSEAAVCRRCCVEWNLKFINLRKSLASYFCGLEPDWLDDAACPMQHAGIKASKGLLLRSTTTSGSHIPLHEPLLTWRPPSSDPHHLTRPFVQDDMPWKETWRRLTEGRRGHFCCNFQSDHEHDQLGPSLGAPVSNLSYWFDPDTVNSCSLRVLWAMEMLSRHREAYVGCRKNSWYERDARTHPDALGRKWWHHELH